MTKKKNTKIDLGIQTYIVRFILIFCVYFIAALTLYAIPYFGWQAIFKKEMPGSSVFDYVLLFGVAVGSIITQRRWYRFRKLPAMKSYDYKNITKKWELFKKNIIPIFVFLSFVVYATLFVMFNLHSSTTPSKDALMPTVIIQDSLPTNKPVFTPIPTDVQQLQQNVYVTPTADTDPIINCKAPIGSKCEGQLLRVKKSVCSTVPVSCCHIGDLWKLMSNAECRAAQNSNTQPAPVRTYIQSYPSCTVYFPGLDHSETFSNISPSQCSAWQQQANSKQPSVTQPSINADTALQAQKQAQNKILYDICIGSVIDKYSDKSGGITGQSGGVSGGVYYGTENNAYQNELSGCSMLFQ